jgi:adenylate cyclase
VDPTRKRRDFGRRIAEHVQGAGSDKIAPNPEEPRLSELELQYEVDGQPQRTALQGPRIALGRGVESDIMLPDPSVSRRHALFERRGATWWVSDQGSTNGIQVNGRAVADAPLTAGDRLNVGPFELRVVGAAALAPTAAEPHASVVRPLAAVVSSLGVAEGLLAAKRSELEAAYGNKIFGFLLRLAGALMSADHQDEVLVRVMDIVFEALPVSRGFILLFEEGGEPVCALARFEDRVALHPREQVPVSRTILRRVLTDQVALITLDAQTDDRLAVGRSIQIHGIRAAMSVPLWSGERIIGVVQVDSPLKGEVFAEKDLDFLTALANYAAVALERLRHREAAEREARLKRRLARYHSPAVIEAVLGRGGAEELANLSSAEVTVLFADVAGFSSLAERLPPERVADLLSDFFDAAVEAIFATGGTLDKFIGDCVMAFFGAPLAQADHASRALAAAAAIQRNLAAVNVSRRSAGLPELAAHIGLMSGPVVVGEVGSSRRVEYTVLGNTVNIAARLTDEVARAGEVVLGASTLAAAGGALPAPSASTLELLGFVQLSGLSQGVEAYRWKPRV